MLRTSSYFLLSVLVPAHALPAQPPLSDTVRRIAALHETVVRNGPTIGPRIWPGFRPDTIPTLYVIPRQAKLFAQWRDTLPTGFFPLPGVGDAAWTDTRVVSFPRGRPIAFLSVDAAASPGSVVGLALHEAFHAFYQAAARPGRRFGAGENSMLVATYPVFDIPNEAAFALEGKLLARALRAPSAVEARRLAQQFLAVRTSRHARLDSTIAEFETVAELHEGLAQYATLRGLRELALRDAARFARDAGVATAIETALLDSLLVVGPRSVRQRFYATGSALALLLDRLADSSWKERLMRDDATLQDMLANATGYRGREALGRPALRRIESELSLLRRDAERAAASLDARRRAQRDSILAGPGLHLVVDPARIPRGRLDWCSFDPQNVLQTAAGELLHMRMLRVCSGPGVEAQFDQPVLEDRKSGVLRALLGTPDAIKLTSRGTPISLPADGTTVEVSDLRIEGPTLSLVASRATLVRRNAELTVIPASAP
ncbi:MAG: hypothetical protein ABR499_10095 [Gemmatimonadaceae bacterium]